MSWITSLENIYTTPLLAIINRSKKANLLFLRMSLCKTTINTIIINPKYPDVDRDNIIANMSTNIFFNIFLLNKLDIISGIYKNNVIDNTTWKALGSHHKLHIRLLSYPNFITSNKSKENVPPWTPSTERGDNKPTWYNAYKARLMTQIT